MELVFFQVSGMANENAKHIIVEFIHDQELFHDKIFDILDKITLVM